MGVGAEGLRLHPRLSALAIHGNHWDLKTVAWTTTGPGFWFHWSDMWPEHQDL